MGLSDIWRIDTDVQTHDQCNADCFHLGQRRMTIERVGRGVTWQSYSVSETPFDFDCIGNIQRLVMVGRLKGQRILPVIELL
jgi:hypothetical protein